MLNQFYLSGREFIAHENIPQGLLLDERFQLLDYVHSSDSTEQKLVQGENALLGV